MAIEWVQITKFGKDPIGAVGFVDGKAAVVVAFHDDLDGNKDGKVGWGEWIAGKVSPISVEGKAVTEVAMQARYDMEVLKRDAGFAQMAAKLYLNFARGLVIDGIYATYFARPVKMLAGGVAKTVVAGKVKEMVIKKGMETAVRAAFNEATDR